jgi:dephospho-CoA kinase
MITAGLTGGIATGKTTVSEQFIKYGIPIVEADTIVNEAILPGTIGFASIVKEFGVSFVKDDGSLNDLELGRFITSDMKMMQKFNRLMNPLLQEEVANQITTLHNNGNPIVIYEATLIIEGGVAHKFKPLIVVHCSLDQQLKRLMKRGIGQGPISKKEGLELLKFQLPSKQRLAMADYVIDTSKSVEDAISQTNAVILDLHLKHYRSQLDKKEISIHNVPLQWRPYLDGSYRKTI